MTGPFTRQRKLDLYCCMQPVGRIPRVAGLDAPVSYSPPVEEGILPSAEKIALAGRELAKY